MAVVLLVIDHIAHRGERGGSRKVALVWSVIWIAAGLGFNLLVYAFLGTQSTSEYLAKRFRHSRSARALSPTRPHDQ